MKLSAKDVENIRKLETKFVSFKFLCQNGSILQFDCLSKNIDAVENISNFEGFDLKPFLIFEDPFRSNPTASVFCYDESLPENYKQKLKDICDKVFGKEDLKFFADVKFYIEDKESSDESKSLLFASDPVDHWADLRSEIISILDEINIKTTFHCHGSMKNECIIGLEDDNLVSLADKIIVLHYIISNVSRSFGQNAILKIENITNLKLSIKFCSVLFKKELDKMKIKVKNASDNNSCIKFVSLENKMLSVEFNIEDKYNAYLMFYDTVKIMFVMI